MSWGFAIYGLFMAFDCFTKVLLNRKHDENWFKTNRKSRKFRETIKIIFGSDLILFWLPILARRSQSENISY